MLKAKTLKNLALTLGEEKPVNDSLSFKKYYIPVNAEQRSRWISECQNLEAEGMFKPDLENETSPDTFMCWHGHSGTKYDRLGVLRFRDEIGISYKTKSAFDACK
jgi:uncharacterized membrane protein